MKTTTKAIFSLGLISFLILGGVCQNAFAVEAKTNNHHHSLTKKHTGSQKHKRVHVNKNSSSVKHTLDKK
jgi:hypothetical protein